MTSSDEKKEIVLSSGDIGVALLSAAMTFVGSLIMFYVRKKHGG